MVLHSEQVLDRSNYFPDMNIAEPVRNEMTNGEIDDQPEDIVECSYEWTCGKCGINFVSIQRHRYPGAEETREDDYAEHRNTSGDTQSKVDLEQHTHKK